MPLDPHMATPGQSCSAPEIKVINVAVEVRNRAQHAFILWKGGQKLRHVVGPNVKKTCQITCVCIPPPPLHSLTTAPTIDTNPFTDNSYSFRITHPGHDSTFRMHPFLSPNILLSISYYSLLQYLPPLALLLLFILNVPPPHITTLLLILILEML